jgi:RNase P subunit RPR2
VVKSPSITVVTVECPRCGETKRRFSIPQPLRVDRRYHYETFCMACDKIFALHITVEAKVTQ